MKKEGKVKTFVKEHGAELVVYTGAGILLACGGVIGWKMCNKVLSGKYVFLQKGNNITNTLIGMRADFPDKFASFTRTNLYEGFKVDELGKLGEVMKECGAPSDALLTHFICLGPEVK